MPGTSTLLTISCLALILLLVIGMIARLEAASRKRQRGQAALREVEGILEDGATAMRRRDRASRRTAGEDPLSNPLHPANPLHWAHVDTPRRGTDVQAGSSGSDGGGPPGGDSGSGF